MNSPIKPLERARALMAYFSPQVIGEVNDVYVKVAKIKKHAEFSKLYYKRAADVWDSM